MNLASINFHPIEAASNSSSGIFVADHAPSSNSPIRRFPFFGSNGGDTLMALVKSAIEKLFCFNFHRNDFCFCRRDDSAQVCPALMLHINSIASSPRFDRF